MKDQNEKPESVTPVASDALLSRWGADVEVWDDGKCKNDSWEATMTIDFNLPISGVILGEITITGWGGSRSRAIQSLDESLECLRQNLMDRFRDND